MSFVMTFSSTSGIMSLSMTEAPHRMTHIKEVDTVTTQEQERKALELIKKEITKKRIEFGLPVE